ncbi:MAG: response regulator, partial [Xanthomonadales bacterium]|nr:response regulator [Xanthomonadales bacterium]
MSKAIKQRILVIDDEPDILTLLDMTLSRMGLAVTTAEDLTVAREKLEQQTFDFCLTDMKLPDGNGLDLVKEISKLYPDLPVAVLTAHGSIEDAVTALKLGAFDFVSKPVNIKDLRRLVEVALKLHPPGSQKQQESISSAHAQKLKGLIGKSPAMDKVRRLTIKLARSQAPIFISGDSGTGKELVAHFIHQLGPRAEGPFVPVNCGAIPADLMESEFFGHTKGSFTGAHE